MSKKALITGIAGFVGPYLKRELENHGYQVYGLDLPKRSTENYFSVDILDVQALKQTLQQIKPDLIFHLAGFSSVKDSFQQPERVRKINVYGTNNLLQAVSERCPQSRILIVSSGHVYQQPKDNQPLIEDSPLDETTSPYAASRVEQEELLNKYQDLDIIISRSFNHIGPGQDQGVIADFCLPIIQSNKPGTIAVGNLEVYRDFTDVRDVVRAYRLLLEKGKSCQIYNVCSGQAIKVSYLLDQLIKFAGKKIKIKSDPEKFRKVDVLVLTGENSKIKIATGWQPEIQLEQTLKDCYNYFLKKNKKQLKVLFITRKYPPAIGGMEQLSYNLTQNIQCQKKIISWGGTQKLLPLIFPFLFIKAFLTANKYDLIHLGDPVLSFIGWSIKKVFKKRVAITLHGLDLTYQNKIYQFYLRLFLKSFDLYIAISSATESLARGKGLTNITTIPVGIKTPPQVETSRQELSKLLKTDLTGKKILITAGRLVKRKGVEWFINQVLPKLDSQVIYIVLGTGPELTAIKTAVKTQGLEDRVFLLGQVSEVIKNLVLNHSDIFVMPNIKVPDDMEGFGIVALEAAVRGLIIIAADLEGISEAIKDQKNGILVPAGQAQAFISKINYWLNNQSTRKEFAKQVKDFTLQEYSWEKIAQLYLSQFKKLFNEKN